MHKIFIFLFFLSGTFFASAFTLEGDNATKGRAIAQESSDRNSGWQSSEAQMSMTLHNKQGQSSTRLIRVKSLEVQGDGDKGLTIFDSPKDVKGTAFLSFSRILEADQQWLYLPRLERVKRINSKNKSGPFMGSEFAYEDLSSFEVEKYSYMFEAEEDLDGIATWRVEMKPVYEHSGYTRMTTWIDQENFNVQRIDFYDRKNSLLKTQTFSDYRLYLDRYWRAHQIHMQNHQNGKSTELSWSDFKFQTGLDEKDFNQNALKRTH